MKAGILILSLLVAVALAWFPGVDAFDKTVAEFALLAIVFAWFKYRKPKPKDDAEYDASYQEARRIMRKYSRAGETNYDPPVKPRGT